MTDHALSTAERAASGFTHKFVITFEDLVAAAIADGSPGAIVLLPFSSAFLIQSLAFRLVTAFSSLTVSGLTMAIGWNGAETDDVDGFLRAKELHGDSTPVLAGVGDGAAFGELDETPTGSIKTGFMALEAGNLEATFTPTGGASGLLTVGEVHIYLKATDLTKL